MEANELKQLRQENERLRKELKQLSNRLENVSAKKGMYSSKSTANDTIKAVSGNEESFKSLFENSTIGLYRTTPEGEILMVNPEALRMLGYSSLEELKTRNLEKEGFHPNYSRMKFKERLEEKGQVKGLESIWTRKDGKEICIRESARAVRDENGKTIYYEGTFEDITAKKSAERKLKKSKKKYHGLFEFAPIAISELDYSEVKKIIEELKKQGISNFQEYFEDHPEKLKSIKDKIRILDVNQTAVELYNAKSKRELVNSMDKIITDDTSEINKVFIIGVAENRKYVVAEDVNLKLNGEKVSCLYKWSVAPGHENNYSKVYIATTDITPIKKAEEALVMAKEKAEEADNMKSAFLANMSHEIRTPMNSIIGFSELLLEKGFSEEEKREFVNIVIQNGKNLLNLINDIIDIAKIESGYLNIEEGSCNPALILNNLHISYKNQIEKQEKKLTFSLKHPEDRIEPFLSDKYRVQQILMNLISNAIKFTQEGKVSIEYYLDKEKKRIVFQVSDTGIGIPESEKDKIFERFGRVKTNYMKDSDGTGLGLFITKQLTTLLGGNIWFDSKLHKGSVFYLSLPYVVTGEKKTNTDAYTTRNIFDFSDKLFLIVEDIDSSYLLLKNLLTNYNAKVMRAVNGQEAIKMASTVDDISIVLMDMKMPEVDGYTATREIKKIRPELPVIAQTAFALVGEDDKCLKVGCEDYVTKPINTRELLEKIEKYL